MICLTSRQKIIISLLIDGKTIKDISSSVGVKSETVRKHIRAVKMKLGANTTINAAALFIRGAQSPLLFLDLANYTAPPEWTIPAPIMTAPAKE